MTTIRIPEPYIVGKTKIASSRLGGGWRRYDLSPHMRIDLSDTRNSTDLNGHINILLFPSQANHEYSEPTDLIFRKIYGEAKKFKYVDPQTKLPIRKKWDYGCIEEENLLKQVPEVKEMLGYFFDGYADNYLVFRKDVVESVESLKFGDDLRTRFLDALQDAHYATYARRIKLFFFLTSLKLEAAGKEPNFERYVEQDSGDKFEALEVKTLNRFRSDFESAKNAGEIWQGYEKNYWGLLKFNGDTGQIGDLHDSIEGLYINPFGSLTLVYKDRLSLDSRALFYAAVVSQICYNIPSFEMHNNLFQNPLSKLPVIGKLFH